MALPTIIQYSDSLWAVEISDVPGFPPGKLVVATEIDAVRLCEQIIQNLPLADPSERGSE